MNNLNISYMTIEHTFWGVRLMHDRMCPAEWDLVIKLRVHSNEDTQEEDKKKAYVAYQKITYWLDGALENVVFVDINDEFGSDVADYYTQGNNLVFLPSQPSDDAIITVLHSKISKISNKVLIIGEISLKGSDTQSTYYYSNTGEYNLPNVGQFLGNDSNPLHKVPWWERDDMDTTDYDRNELDNDSIKELLSRSVELKQFEKKLFKAIKGEEVDTELDEMNITPDTVIRIPEWKPKLVE